jgi:molybdopterin-binding protein
MRSNSATTRSSQMRLSTRNQLKGTVAAIDVGSVMTIVKIDLDGGQRMTASVTRDGVDELGLQVGSPVVALIKATEVMLGVEED